MGHLHLNGLAHSRRHNYNKNIHRREQEMKPLAAKPIMLLTVPEQSMALASMKTATSPASIMTAKNPATTPTTPEAKPKTKLNLGGALTGAVSGASLGATLGTIIPGVGNVVGGIVGGVGGFLVGLFKGKKSKTETEAGAKQTQAITEAVGKIDPEKAKKGFETVKTIGTSVIKLFSKSA